MGTELISGVTLHPLKIIEHPLGNVLHGMKASDPGFSGFGEAYFSTIKPGAIKGWKKHNQMTLNLIVPMGEIRFVVFDDRPDSPTQNQFFEVSLSQRNYQRLTVEPDLWVAFQGLKQGQNFLLNLASIEHDPRETTSCPLEAIAFDWE